MNLARNEIPLADRERLPPPDFWTRFKLRRALSSLAKVIQLAPDNYSANWFAGKIHQRFGEHRDALRFFRRAAEINPTQADVLREASISATDAGETDDAVTFARRAVEIERDNPGLRANLALTLLLAGRVDEAANEIYVAEIAEAPDTITATVAKLIKHYQKSGEQPPRTLSELKKVSVRLK